MKIVLLIVSLLWTCLLFAQSCDTSMLINDQVRASDTDPNIPFELVRHHTFYNPSCTPKNVLLVHMVGTFASPFQSVLFPKLAGNYGYHVLSLNYPNDTAAQTACGTSNDIDCHYKFRKEIIDGVDVSTEIQVDSVNSIQNRLIRLLQYMEVNNPTQNWGQYFTGDSIHWNKVMLSGHSQGGGHAAMMAIDRPVKRVIMFASPNDYSVNFNQVASWTNLPHVAADSAYFSFNNRNDQVAEYAWQYGAALNLGVTGDSIIVDGNQCPYNWSHNTYTALNFSGLGGNHGSVVQDANVPLDANGIPLYKDVWLYLLGEPCASLTVNEKEIEVKVSPNPAISVVEVQLNTNAQEFQLFNTLGECVQSKDNLTNPFQLDLSKLPVGIYQLRLQHDFGITTRKIIKQ